MKKVRTIVLPLCLLCLLCSAVLCACHKPDVPSTPQHEHTYVRSVVKTATCAEEGIASYKCSGCGDFYSEYLPTLEHDYEYAFDDEHHWLRCTQCNAETDKQPHQFVATELTPPDCTTDGERQLSCKCGAHSVETLDKTAHRYETVYDDTEHWQKCADCGHTTEPVAHTFAATNVSLPDCSHTGTQKLTCDCGYTRTETTDALGHDMTGDITCDENFHYFACKNCGEQVKESHAWQDLPCKDNRAATCSQAGHTSQICTVCNREKHTEIPATGQHNYGKWLSDQTQHWKVCQNAQCGHIGYAAAHAPQTRTTPSTCVDHGTKTVYCAECGYIISETTLELSRHVLTRVDEQPATDVADGHIAYYLCEYCNKMFDDLSAEHELSADDIVIAKSEFYTAATIAQLRERAQQGNTQLCRITLTVKGVAAATHSLECTDGTDLVNVIPNSRCKIDRIEVGNSITLICKPTLDANGNLSLAEVEIEYVVGKPGYATLTLEFVGQVGQVMIYDGETITADGIYYNRLEIGATLIIRLPSTSVSCTVNGEAQSGTMLLLTITGDMHIVITGPTAAATTSARTARQIAVCADKYGVWRDEQPRKI